MQTTLDQPPPVLTPQLDLLPQHGELFEDDVHTQIWGLLATFYPDRDITERRRETRYPFPSLVHLTPVGSDGVTPEGETIVVIGKHLSVRGLGFYHPMPLADRRMIVSLETSISSESGTCSEDGYSQWIGFLIDLSWCRFTGEGWYESGGRFLQAVLSPLGSCQETTIAGQGG
ncbi:MAG: hypothetical protein HQ567_32295 [Candidatus Nealsonbacteria bacterium]|nr:hypothetical protein [Candidatus Nealsonbacteria bacterium]